MAAEAQPSTDYEAVDLDAALQQRYKRKLARIDVAGPPPKRGGGASGSAALGAEKEALAAALTCTVRTPPAGSGTTLDLSAALKPAVCQDGVLEQGVSVDR